MIASEDDLINGLLLLFKNFEEIIIFANRYSDASIKILKHFGKKCRPSCLKNQKCLYKMWNKDTVKERVKKLFENRSQQECNVEHPFEVMPSQENNISPRNIIDNDQPQPETNVEHSPQTTTPQEQSDCQLYQRDANADHSISSSPTGDEIQVLAEEDRMVVLCVGSTSSDDSAEYNEISHLQSRIQALETDNKMLLSTVSEMTAKNKLLEEKMASTGSVPGLEKQIKELIANVASTERRNDELKIESVHRGKVIKELQASLYDLKKNNCEATGLIEDLQNELKQSRLDHLKLDAAKQLEIESLQQIISTKEENIKVMQRLNNDLQLKLEKSSQIDKENEKDLTIKPNEPKAVIDTTDNVIRCVCGLFADNWPLIQCRKCSVYQHIQCVDAELNAEYSCELCEERVVNQEIALKDLTDKGHRYYLTLMRDDLQVRKSDTVYILRDIPMVTNAEAASPKKHTYKTIGEINYTQCDIFRVEHLWKDNDGNGFVFGYNYLRPEETYYEPNRKFYRNELIRVPIFEEIPIEMILGRCWVLDPTTYCKGRPIGCDESHLYISDLKTNKARNAFSKIVRQQFPVCKKSFAFTKFEQKMKISRNYTPHLRDTTGPSNSEIDHDSNPRPSKVRRVL